MFESERAEHDILVLNGLIETTLDSVDGYHQAAQACEEEEVRRAFIARVEERRQVIHRLCERVRQLGGRPEDEGSILASAHRFFLRVRDRVDSDAVIGEVDHGESYLAGKWQAALEDGDLTPETRQLIGGCYESIRRGHEQWRGLNRGAGNSATANGFELAGIGAGRLD